MFNLCFFDNQTWSCFRDKEQVNLESAKNLMLWFRNESASCEITICTLCKDLLSSSLVSAVFVFTVMSGEAGWCWQMLSSVCSLLVCFFYKMILCIFGYRNMLFSPVVLLRANLCLPSVNLCHLVEMIRDEKQISCPLAELLKNSWLLSNFKWQTVRRFDFTDHLCRESWHK